MMASATLYIYEIAIRTYEQNRTTGKDHDLINDAAHFEALRTCLDASHSVINQYLSFSVTDARCLPDSCLLWTVYAAVMLIKLSHFIQMMSATLQRSYKPTVRLLESVIARLAEISKDGYWPQAKEFGVLFERLRRWYLYKRAVCRLGDPACNLVGISPSVDATSGAIEGGRVEERVIDTRTNAPTMDWGALRSDKDLPGSSGATDDVEMYENINWDNFTFGVDEMNAFDANMQDGGWMTYFYDQQPMMGDEWSNNAGVFKARDALE
jgi:hypothetical protein